MIYDRNLDKTFTMDMMSIEEMKEVLTFLMPIIEENKVSINVEGNQLRNVMNINEDLLDMSKRRNIPLIDKTGDIDGVNGIKDSHKSDGIELPDDIRVQALRWASQRGGRSGRIAYQFSRYWQGQMQLAADDSES